MSITDTHIRSNPLIDTDTCASQGVRNVSFSENFANILNEWSPSGSFTRLIDLIDHGGSKEKEKQL